MSMNEGLERGMKRMEHGELLDATCLYVCMYVCLSVCLVCMYVWMDGWMDGFFSPKGLFSACVDGSLALVAASALAAGRLLYCSVWLFLLEEVHINGFFCRRLPLCWVVRLLWAWRLGVMACSPESVGAPRVRRQGIRL